jgi:cobalt-zinc-cadmium efflux system outer membrane protein
MEMRRDMDMIQHVRRLLAGVAVVLLIGLPVTAAAAQGIAPTTAGSEPRGAPIPGELDLRTALEHALLQHPLVEAARARVRAKQGAGLTARLPLNPVITYAVENAPFPGGAPFPGVERETSLYATLPLEPLFQRWPSARRAGAEVHAAEAELALARRDVALAVARAFYRLALAQAATEAAGEVRDRLTDLAAYNRARVGEGVSAEGDLIRVQVELDRAGAALALERAEQARARADLAAHLGGLPQRERDPTAWAVDSLRVSTESGGAGDTVLPQLDAYLSWAREGRPDLVAARARVTAAQAEAALQRTAIIRQVGATFGVKRISGRNTMIAGLSLPIPLFDQNVGEIRRASGERAAAEQHLAWTERQVLAQVSGAYTAARLLAEQVKRLEGTFLARAEESRAIALAAYQEGAASLLQVLDASRALADARVTYYRTVFAWRESLLELHIMAGTEPLDAITGPPVATSGGRQ